MVFSYSGKPVYTRYGSEDGISSTTGALAAIVSKMAVFFSNQAQPDSLRYMAADDRIITFLERGPLWLVCISRCGDTYNDMVVLLERVHAQIIALLTTGVEQTLKRHPNYDMRNLLGGTDCVVNSMIRWCTQDLFLQQEGFEPLPLPSNVRNTAVEALKSARVPNVLCAFLMAGHRLLAVVHNRQYKLHALDLGMIINIIMSFASLGSGESWTPVCLAHLRDTAFAYAYISFMEDLAVGCVFISTSSESEQFYAISQQASNIKRSLQSSGCLATVIEAMSHCPIDLRSVNADDGVKGGGPVKKTILAPPPSGEWRLLDGIIHAAYFVPSLGQLFSSAIAPDYQSKKQTKMLFRSYGRCRLLLRNAKMPSQVCIATDNECFYVSLHAEFHMYLTVPRGISTAVIRQFYQWVKIQEPHIFLGHLPTW